MFRIICIIYGSSYPSTSVRGYILAIYGWLRAYTSSRDLRSLGVIPLISMNTTCLPHTITAFLPALSKLASAWYHNLRIKCACLIGRSPVPFWDLVKWTNLAPFVKFELVCIMEIIAGLWECTFENTIILLLILQKHCGLIISLLTCLIIELIVYCLWRSCEVSQSFIYVL